MAHPVEGWDQPGIQRGLFDLGLWQQIYGIYMITEHVRCVRSLGIRRASLGVSTVVACVAILVLWVRSNEWRDSLLVRIPTGKTIFIQSRDGEVSLAICHLPLISAVTTQFHSAKPRTPAVQLNPERNENFDLAVLPLNTTIVLPHWYLMLGCGALCWAACSRWAFRLRTLLLVMTVFAVLLGLNPELMQSARR